MNQTDGGKTESRGDSSVLILSAMDSEQEAFVRSGKFTEKKIGTVPVREGTLFGRYAVLARTGVGKVLSASVTQRLLDSREIGEVIFTGIAGALDPRLEVGDLFIAREVMQWDLDATRFGWKRGEIPYAGIREVVCDPRMVERAARFSPRGDGRFPAVGRLLTGDTFLEKTDPERFRILREELSGAAVDMEGAAVGTVCALSGVPFLVLRVISDQAGGGIPKDFRGFMREAAGLTARVVEFLLAGRRDT